MTDQITEMLNQARMADGKPMSDERLSEVFDLVKSPEGWKMPINAQVPIEAATRAEIETAVCWFAGGIPTVVELAETWWVTGDGYYEWIGA